MARLIAIAMVAIAAYYALLFAVQRRMLFQPPPASPRPGANQAEVVELRTESGIVEALYLAAADGDSPSPLLLFLHGNAELADYWIDEFGEPRRWGWSILLLEYPGYGRSAGEPSERSITDAALAAFDWARRDPRIDAARIVPYGRSLGGGAAARLAADRPVAALVLESSSTSVRALAARYLAPGFLVRDPFDALASLRRYAGPLLVVHGARDAVIPATHGRALAAAVPNAEYHELPCGHNDCPRPWPRLQAFLAANGLLARRAQ